MSKGKTVLKVLSAVGLTAVLGGSLYLVGSNWNSIKAGINGEVLFTQSQVQEKVDQAYNDGVAQGEVYKAIIDELTSNLTSTQNELAKIQAEQEQSKAEIASKNAQIEQLQAEVKNLTEQNTDNTAIINQKNEQILTLKNEVKQLQANLNNSNESVLTLTAQIQTLNNTVSYYEQLLKAYQNESKAIATYMFNNGVYNVQVVDKGQTTSVNNPTSTEYVKFNYWMVDNEQVDPSTYPINEDTIFVANVTYSYDVKFVGENKEELKTQIVEENNFSTPPNNPTSSTNGVFKGWSLDGINLVDPSSTEITGNTTFYAMFDYPVEVRFELEDGTEVDTQEVFVGNKATTPDEPTKTGYTFIGWYYNGEQVDPSTITITSNLTFIAKFEIKTFTVSYYSEDVFVESVIVDYNNTPTYAPNVSKEGYIFKGWSLDKTSVVNPSTVKITEDTVFYAIFEKEITMNGTFKINSLSAESGITFTFTVSNNEIISAETTAVFNNAPEVNIEKKSDKNFEITFSGTNSVLTQTIVVNITYSDSIEGWLLNSVNVKMGNLEAQDITNQFIKNIERLSV